MIWKPPPVAVKTGSKSNVRQINSSIGMVLEVVGHVALVRMEKTALHERVRADILPGKSAAPKPGERWIFEQRYGAGWNFSAPMNFAGGDQDWITPVLVNDWTSVGAPNLPVGYIRDAGGWVTLCGKLSGGTVGLMAFTLPAGYCPEALWDQLVLAGGGIGHVSVAPSGTLTVVSGTVPISLDAVRFLAAS